MSILRPHTPPAVGAPARRPRPTLALGRPLALLMLAAATTLLSACASKGGVKAAGWTPPEPRVGVPQPLQGMQDYHFNGATREVSPPKSFRQDDVIRVVVTDANPFLFDYKILHNGQRVVEASISDFFNFRFGINFPAAKEEGQTTDAPLAAMTEAFMEGIFNSCSDDEETAAAALKVRLDVANDRRDEFVATFDSIQKFAQTTDSRFAQATAAYSHPNALAPDVKEAAMFGAGLMQSYVDTISALTVGLPGAVASWAKVVGDLNDDAAELGSSCPAVREVVEGAAKLVPDTATFRTNVETAATKVSDADTEYQRIHLIAADDGRYYRTGLLPRFDVPTDVTLTVQRRPAGSGENYHDVAVQRINVGGRARFSLSAGLGWTELGTTSYAVTTRFVTPQAAGTDSIHTIVARDNSADQVFPMATFNTLLTPSGWRLPVNPHLVLGVGVSRKDRTPLPGYLVGLGTDALSRRLLVIGGVFFGEEQRLGGGLRVGDRVPGSIGEDIPVERRLVSKLGIGVTYRIF